MSRTASKPIVHRKPHAVSIPGRIKAFLVYALIRLVALTIRFRWIDSSGIINEKNKQPIIFSIWHNRLALCAIIYRSYIRKRQPERRMAALVSASRDGGFLSDVLRRFGFDAVRGSTSRRGPQALRELTNHGRKGCNLAITPDGPRGPRYVVQDGVIWLAQVTGYPIVPVSYHLNRKIELKSWDKFQVPLPFSVCTVYLSEPMRVPRDAGVEERETALSELQRRMGEITYD